MAKALKHCSSKLTSIALAISVATAGLSVSARADDPGWPRERDHDGAHLVLYQPQVDNWTQFKQVSGRMAISITPKGGKQQVGVVTFQMNTDTDMDSRTVLLTAPSITETSFPGTDTATAKKLDHLVRTFLNPSATETISVDRLVASVDQKNETPGIQVKNDPPVIYVSLGSAILLFVDGDPVLAPVQNVDMQAVVNANWPLFLDPATRQYYLFNGQRWVVSADLKGGWKEAPALPPKMAKIPSDPQWASLKLYLGATSAKPCGFLQQCSCGADRIQRQTSLCRNSRNQAQLRNQHGQHPVPLFTDWRLLLPERRPLVFGTGTNRSVDLCDRPVARGLRQNSTGQCRWKGIEFGSRNARSQGCGPAGPDPHYGRDQPYGRRCPGKGRV